MPLNVDELRKVLRAHEQMATALRGLIAAMESGDALPLVTAVVHTNGNGHNGHGVPAFPETPHANGDATGVQARRMKSAALLMAFSRTEVRPSGGIRGIGPLVAHGYLKAKGDGYLRTAKAFAV